MKKEYVTTYLFDITMNVIFLFILIVINQSYFTYSINHDIDINEIDSIELDKCLQRYFAIKEDQELNNDYNCSACGKKVLAKYKELHNQINDEKSDDYLKIKEEIKKLEICNNNDKIIVEKREEENTEDKENNDENSEKKEEEDEEKDDQNCNMIEFGECAQAVTVRDAESQCNNQGKCPEALISKLHSCYNKIKYGPKGDIAILDQPYYKSVEVLGFPFIFVCSQAGNEWCYDKYKAAYNNTKLMQEFVCSECGNAVLSYYNSSFDKITDLEDEEYDIILEHIHLLNKCKMGEDNRYNIIYIDSNPD
ncbi:hypothetical protein LY90DRAFT_519250 [Neocallimastix californiae]|uniref:Uncharacterized protein n=1 Tax=Neocallimastix californiae TaxID=1754190 RepID=A0A1Y1Z715_9FUNG|nr:hypothetical protein LY90DRAFT_519250 [Neocallimastix californiae]|eukprot:ORY06043.1 hypothetical protein LY90DRAFT_519250 [Neocallimastix californiae]